MKVLLLVDIQNDFCPGGGLAVPDGDKIVPVVNSLMNNGKYDYIVASRDVHPAEHISLAGNHEGKKPFDTVNISYDGRTIEQPLWPEHCVEGTSGVEFHPDLDIDKIDSIIDKGTNPYLDSLSAFFYSEKLDKTDLLKVLDSKLAEVGETITDLELTVVGLATDYCVAETVKDALSLGIKTELVLEGCRAVNINPSDELKTLRDLAQLGASIVSVSERVSELSLIHKSLAENRQASSLDQQRSI